MFSDKAIDVMTAQVAVQAALVDALRKCGDAMRSLAGIINAPVATSHAA